MFCDSICYLFSLRSTDSEMLNERLSQNVVEKCMSDYYEENSF